MTEFFMQGWTWQFSVPVGLALIGLWVYIIRAEIKERRWYRDKGDRS